MNAILSPQCSCMSPLSSSALTNLVSIGNLDKESLKSISMILDKNIIIETQQTYSRRIVNTGAFTRSLTAVLSIWHAISCSCVWQGIENILVFLPSYDMQDSILLMEISSMGSMPILETWFKKFDLAVNGCACCRCCCVIMFNMRFGCSTLREAKVLG